MISVHLRPWYVHASPPHVAGLHSGSIMSGIVGKIRRRWCLFGDCMNMAARTESSCPPGCVQLTSDTYELAAEALQGIVELRDHGLVKVKGHEEPLHMYLAYPLSPEWETPLASGGEEEDATGCPSDGDFSMSTCEPQATACAYHASPVSGQRHAKFFNVASTSTNIPAMPACTRGRMAFEEATAIHPGEPHKYGGFVSEKPLSPAMDECAACQVARNLCMHRLESVSAPAG